MAARICLPAFPGGTSEAHFLKHLLGNEARSEILFYFYLERVESASPQPEPIRFRAPGGLVYAGRVLGGSQLPSPRPLTWWRPLFSFLEPRQGVARPPLIREGARWVGLGLGR